MFRHRRTLAGGMKRSQEERRRAVVDLTRDEVDLAADESPPERRARPDEPETDETALAAYRAARAAYDAAYQAAIAAGASPANARAAAHAASRTALANAGVSEKRASAAARSQQAAAAATQHLPPARSQAAASAATQPLPPAPASTPAAAYEFDQLYPPPPFVTVEQLSTAASTRGILGSNGPQNSHSDSTFPFTPATQPHSAQPVAGAAAAPQAQPAQPAQPADNGLRSFERLNPRADITDFQNRVVALSSDRKLTREARQLAVALYNAAVAGEPGVTDPRSIAQTWSAERVSPQTLLALQATNEDLHDWFALVQDDVESAGDAFRPGFERWWREDDVARAQTLRRQAAALAQQDFKESERIDAEIAEKQRRKNRRFMRKFMRGVDRARNEQSERDFPSSVQRIWMPSKAEFDAAVSEADAAAGATTVPSCAELAQYEHRAREHPQGVLKWYIDFYIPRHGELNHAKFRTLILACHPDKLSAQLEVAHNAAAFLSSLRSAINGLET